MLIENQNSDKCCSSGGCCNEASVKKVLIEYLYLDLNTCDRCIGTDKILDEVMVILTPTLELAGYKVEYNKVEMESAEMAIQYKFLSSPTIRVNRKDICTSVEENSCGCCSDIGGTDVDCRVFKYNGETYEIPPKDMLANDILCNVFGADSDSCAYDTEYKLPENLSSFYEGKKTTGYSCGGKGC